MDYALVKLFILLASMSFSEAKRWQNYFATIRYPAVKKTKQMALARQPQIRRLEFRKKELKSRLPIMWALP